MYRLIKQYFYLVKIFTILAPRKFLSKIINQLLNYQKFVNNVKTQQTFETIVFVILGDKPQTAEFTQVGKM